MELNVGRWTTLLLWLLTGVSSINISPVYKNPSREPSSTEPVQSFSSSGATSYTTRTVYGFVDFTTTVGNTVMVFTPKSVPPDKNKTKPTKPTKDIQPTKSITSSTVRIFSTALREPEISKPSSTIELDLEYFLQPSTVDPSFGIGETDFLDANTVFPDTTHDNKYDFLSTAGDVVAVEAYQVKDLDEESDTSTLMGDYPTGIVTQMGGTIINDGLTTVHETHVVGTFIQGNYAQILQSTSRIFRDENESTSTSTDNISTISATTVEKITTTKPVPSVETTTAGSVRKHLRNRYNNNQGQRQNFNFFRRFQKNRLKQRQRAKNEEDEDLNVSESRQQKVFRLPDSIRRGGSFGRRTENTTPSPSLSPSFKFGSFRRNRRPKPSVSTVYAESGSDEEEVSADRYETVRPFRRRRPNKSRVPLRTRNRYGQRNSYNTEPSYNRGYSRRISTSSVRPVPSNLYRFRPKPTNVNRYTPTQQYHSIEAVYSSVDPSVSYVDDIHDDVVEEPYIYSTLYPDIVPDVDEEGYDITTESFEYVTNDEPVYIQQEAEENIYPQYAYDDDDYETTAVTGAETLAVSTTIPVDVEGVYYELAVVRTPLVLKVGPVKSTHYATVTETVTRTMENFFQSESIEIIDPSLPLTENILATTAPVYEPLSDNIVTLPPVILSGGRTPPLETVVDTFTTTETMYKTSLLPVVRGAETETYTLKQSYYITKMITALRTMPPSEMYEFIPSNTLQEFNSILLEAGSENQEHLLPGELEFGENDEQDGDQGTEEAVLEEEDAPPNEHRVPPPPGFQGGDPINPTPPFPLPLPGGAPTPQLSAQQLQQLAYLQLLNSYQQLQPAAPFNDYTTTTSEVTLSTTVTETDTKVYNIYFSGRRTQTTIYQTMVKPTELTTYETKSVLVRPTTFPFLPLPGYLG